MSVPVMKHWLSPSIRRNRKSFTLSCMIALNVIFAAGMAVCFFLFLYILDVDAAALSNFMFELNPEYDPFDEIEFESWNATIAGLLLMAFCFFYLLFVFFLTAQRFRDMGVTGWLCWLWLLASFLPYVLSVIASLVLTGVLCLVPGTRGDNRYGPDPLDS